VREYSKNKYSENPIHRQKVREYSNNKYSENQSHRQKVREYSNNKYSENQIIDKKLSNTVNQSTGNCPLSEIRLQLHRFRNMQQIHCSGTL
jgi:hypothetical protein